MMPPPYPAFSAPEELQVLIDEYFKDCESRRELANHVDFANYLRVPRRTLARYVHKEGFGEILELAKQRIEGQRVRQLLDKDRPTAGVIFDLVNNYGWINSQRTEHSGPGGGPIPIQSSSDYALLKDTILAALKPFPEAFQAVAEAMITLERRALAAGGDDEIPALG